MLISKLMLISVTARPKKSILSSVQVTQLQNLFEQSGRNEEEEEEERMRKMALLQPHTFAFSCLPRGCWALI